jgi:hypothetical protein
MLLPDTGGIRGIHVRLAILVGLVETEDVVGIARLDELGELINLLVTPEHGDTCEAKVLGAIGAKRAPRVDAEGKMS